MLWLQDSQDYRKDVARIALKDVKYRGRGANNEPEPHHGGVARTLDLAPEKTARKENRTLDLAPEKTARKENIRHIGVTLVMYYPLRVLLGFLFALLAFVRGIDVLCPRVRSKLWKKSGLKRVRFPRRHSRGQGESSESFVRNVRGVHRWGRIV